MQTSCAAPSDYARFAIGDRRHIADIKKPAVSGRALEIGGQELYGFAGSGGGAGLTGGGCVISWVGAGATLSWLPHIPDSYP